MAPIVSQRRSVKMGVPSGPTHWRMPPVWSEGGAGCGGGAVAGSYASTSGGSIDWVV
jgi:hypothetical protein